MPNDLSMKAWFAAEAGIPLAVQHLYDLTEYERQAMEIEEFERCSI